MQLQTAFKLLLWTSLTSASLFCHGWGEKCTTNDHAPTVQQSRVELGNSPTYKVEVQNKCPMCPVINLHLKCGSFPQALVDPKLLKVLSDDDCVVNSGLPLAPMQKIYFNYSHQMYQMSPKIWYFQCE